MRRQQRNAEDQQREQPRRRLEQCNNDQGNQNGRGQDALHEECPSPMRPPKRRSRFWNASIASSNSLPRKSGHSVSVTKISAYAACHSRKLLSRISPLVRISRSSSGNPCVYRWRIIAFSSTFIWSSPPLREA